MKDINASFPRIIELILKLSMLYQRIARFVEDAIADIFQICKSEGRFIGRRSYPCCNGIGHHSHLKRINMKEKDVQLIVYILHEP